MEKVFTHTANCGSCNLSPPRLNRTLLTETIGRHLARHQMCGGICACLEVCCGVKSVKGIHTSQNKHKQLPCLDHRSPTMHWAWTFVLADAKRHACHVAQGGRSWHCISNCMCSARRPWVPDVAGMLQRIDAIFGRPLLSKTFGSRLRAEQWWSPAQVLSTDGVYGGNNRTGSAIPIGKMSNGMVMFENVLRHWHIEAEHGDQTHVDVQRRGPFRSERKATRRMFLTCKSWVDNQRHWAGEQGDDELGGQTVADSTRRVAKALPGKASPVKMD